MPCASDHIDVTVRFYSFFKELTGCSSTTQSVPSESTVAHLLNLVFQRFPKLELMQKSMLVAVGVEYQDRQYVLREGDEVSLFPPVQGG
jgi:MoaD family protein